MIELKLNAKFHLSDLPEQLVSNLDKQDLLQLIVGIQQSFNKHTWPGEGIHLEIALIKHFKAIEEELLLDYNASSVTPPNLMPLKIEFNP